MKKFVFILSLTLAACSSDDSASNNDIETDDIDSADTGDNSDDAGTSDDSGTEAFAGVCNYTNQFSMGAECREYLSGWSPEDAQADCDATLNGSLAEGVCESEELIGNCDVTTDLGGQRWYFYGETAGCQFAKLGCDAFDGTYTAGPRCDDVNVSTSNVFLPPELICTEPLDGQPGDGPNGEVCTWQAISGATEEGRKFTDYASCDVVRTQRPYFPVARPDDAERVDERLEDPVYAGELAWVKSQIEATACVCCHAASVTPDGASNWDIEQPGNFMNGFFDTGLALGANWVNSEAFGAYPRSENNNFDRTGSGFPSTDPDRMRAFFEAELALRGFVEGDFVDARPFGGPLYDQIYYEPTACESGEGVNAEGDVSWSGGNARYLYILEQGSLSPTVPPNLDTPDGTVWRLDVAPDSDPISSGDLKLGDAPVGATQRVPENGAPVLTSGETYYLYVSADVGIPVTRCEFTAP